MIGAGAPWLIAGIFLGMLAVITVMWISWLHRNHSNAERCGTCGQLLPAQHDDAPH